MQYPTAVRTLASVGSPPAGDGRSGGGAGKSGRGGFLRDRLSSGGRTEVIGVERLPPREPFPDDLLHLNYFY